MFNEQLKMGDGLRLQLDCAHDFTGGAMACKVCGEAFQVAVAATEVVMGEVEGCKFEENFEMHIT